MSFLYIATVNDALLHNDVTYFYTCVHYCCISTVSDADGDVVRCRWATSSQGECAGVCGTFPATIDQVC